MKLISQTDIAAYIPRLKTKTFNPTPIQGFIPKYADSRTNPSCISTPAYRDYWDEQIYYCEHGYHTGGIFIPPIYYHYLNFKVIDGPAGATYPMFSDTHLEIFEIIHHIKSTGEYLGAVFPKARRIGLSFVFTEVVDWGCKFTDRYRALVAGGESSYIDAFRSKLYRTYNNTVPEFKQNHIRRNDNELLLGWGYKTDQGLQQFEHSTVLFKTMKDNPKKAEGEYFNDVVLEEFGIFEKGIETLNSIIPALKMGNINKGAIWALGTGGNVLKGSAAFKELYYQAASFNFLRMFISGKRFFLPYVVGTIDPQTRADISIYPNLKEQYPDKTKEELRGCEDIVAAEAEVRAERIRRSKNPNKSQLTQWNQHMPLEVEEVFTSSGVNDFNADLLYGQSIVIDENEVKYSNYVLSFKKNDDGTYIMPLKVEARPAKPSDPEWKIVKILEGPKPEYSNLDVLGIDSYNEDKSNTSSSLGGCIVLRRYNSITDPTSKLFESKRSIIPVAVYYSRPPRKEQHWEIGLMLAVWYNTLKNTIIAAEVDMMIKYFKDMGCKKYLAKRPTSFDSPETKLSNEYGVKMTGFSKPRMLSLMQSYIEDYISECWFAELIRDLLAYDKENIGTDYDLADALGYALMHIVELKKIPEKTNVDNQNNDLSLPRYRKTTDDNLIDTTSFSKDSDTGEEELEEFEKIILAMR